MLMCHESLHVSEALCFAFVLGVVCQLGVIPLSCQASSGSRSANEKNLFDIWKGK